MIPLDDLDEGELRDLVASVRGLDEGHAAMTDAEVLVTLMADGAPAGWLAAHCPVKKVLLWVVGPDVGDVMLDKIPEHRLDKDVCMAAVSDCASCLKYVPPRLRDRDVCAAAVRSHGWALSYVPIELRDKEMCVIAVTSTALAWRHVPEPLRASVWEESGRVPRPDGGTTVDDPS